MKKKKIILVKIKKTTARWRRREAHEILPLRRCWPGINAAAAPCGLLAQGGKRRERERPITPRRNCHIRCCAEKVPMPV